MSDKKNSISMYFILTTDKAHEHDGNLTLEYTFTDRILRESHAIILRDNSVPTKWQRGILFLTRNYHTIAEK